MPRKQTARYGSWKSPITASLIARGGVRLGEVRLDGDDACWLEGRPAEGGRNVVVRMTKSGPRDMTPAGFNVRNRVHEYGGGAYAVAGGEVYFTNWADQRIYRQSIRGKPVPITPGPRSQHALRYADLQVTPNGKHVACVRERHVKGKEAVNEIVAVPTRGGAPKVIASGRDFYSFPGVSPDGRQAAWTCWDHPNMPWDGSELWVAALDSAMRASDARKVAGGKGESIF